MKAKEKNLSGNDILLNLDEINVCVDSFSSSGCSGPTSFYINTSTKHGYCEDPNFSGKIKILETKKGKGQRVYTLKVKFEKEEED